MSKPQKRVMLWSCAKSMSTAFLRAMANRPGTKAIMEPHLDTYYYSSDKTSNRFKDQPAIEGCTYLDIKRKCEMSYPDYDAVFVKNMAYYITGSPETIKHRLPEGYVHSFLIRNPNKAIPSAYKTILDEGNSRTGWDYFDPSEAGYKELYQMYKVVTEILGQEDAIILDADDLLENPEAVMRHYCKHVELSFHGNIINWSSGSQFLQGFDIDSWATWLRSALKYNTFKKIAPKADKNNFDIPQTVVDTIQECTEYYNLLYDKRYTFQEH